MTIVLMAVGLLVAAAGFVTIGFGIPINAFSLGNTLIVAGTIAVTSGFILIALAVLIGHLKRIADALKTGPVRTAQPVEAAAAGVAAPEPPRMAAPKAEPAPQETHAPEPRLPTPASEAAPGPLDWLRAKAKPAGSAPVPPVEPPVVEITDEAPLSPRPPVRPAIPAEPESKVWSPGRPGGPLSARVEPPAPRTPPAADQQRERERFEQMWERGAPSPAAPQPASSEPIKREPTLDMPLPPIPARPRDGRPAPERRSEPPPAPKPAPERERGPAILKSGVIDGMPYTLYADGSIEAELPSGTVKFASVDALRSHLEKQG